MSTAPPSGPIGIVANPLAGKDVRRLAARASVFDNEEKRAILRRVVAGALAAEADQIRYMRDSHGIAEAIANEFSERASFKPVEAPRTASALDTTRAAAALREAGCAVALTLGGDGTNRAFALGWRDAPLVPVSTGTNNVFPHLLEGTVAGAAAGLIARGALRAEDVTTRAKAITVEIEGERPDLALVDAVLSVERFVGARALLDGSRLRLALLTRADPSAVGVTAIGGLVQPLSEHEDCGLLLELGAGSETVRAPLAPGLYQEFAVGAVRTVSFGEPVQTCGPGVLALDGERERVLRSGQRATLRLERDGPRVVDVERALRRAACEGLFRKRSTELHQVQLCAEPTATRASDAD